MPDDITFTYSTDPGDDITFDITTPSGGGGGAVDSVNGQTGVVVLDAADVGADAEGAAAAVQAASQPLDSDLTAIAALTTTSYGRGLLALADAAAARTSVGLGSVDNTSDASKPVSTAQAAAIAAVSPAYPTPTGGRVGNFRSGDFAVANLGAAGRLLLVPFPVPAGGYTQIAVRSTVAAAATWRLGVYPMASNGGPDWANVHDAGTVNMNATAGDQPITIAWTLTRGWVFGAVLVDAYTANPTVYASNSPNPPMLPGLPQDSSNVATLALYWTGVTTGALPTSSPGTALGSNQTPRIQLTKG